MTTKNNNNEDKMTTKLFLQYLFIGLIFWPALPFVIYLRHKKLKSNKEEAEKIAIENTERKKRIAYLENCLDKINSKIDIAKTSIEPNNAEIEKLYFDRQSIKEEIEQLTTKINTIVLVR